jgi:cellulose synthase/poly-beta-1,6-N-acetylglucosamine synthase-like glycosyltransferase
MQEIFYEIGVAYDWLLGLFVFLSFGYAILMISMLTGFLRTPKRTQKKLNEQDLPLVSVLVCAKNEEKDIGSCLRSLSAIDYPKERIKIIAVNDSSDDLTQQIMEEHAVIDPRITVMNTLEMPESSLIAKGRAISWGMTEVVGEWVFLTDADSVVPTSWVKCLLSHASEDTGL